MTRTALRICPLCEATCGLTLTIEDGRVTGARGDRDDVFSAGFICPKGASFAELDNDPDRLPSSDGPSRRRADRGDVGRGVRRRRRTARRGHPRARRDVGRRVSGQPERTHRCGQPVSAVAHPRARHPSGVLRQHAGPDAQTRCAGPHVRQPGRFHRAGPRPHRLPRDHRRESACVQRKFGHRGRLSRQAAGAAQARRQAHRDRPGAHAHC